MLKAPSKRVAAGGWLSRRALATSLAVLCLAGCGEPAVSVGGLRGDPETGCVWGEETTGERFEVALPRGWSATTDPVAVLDPDGGVVVEEGYIVWGAPARLPLQSGRVLCEVDGASSTVRFRDIYPTTSHIDDERGGKP